MGKLAPLAVAFVIATTAAARDTNGPDDRLATAVHEALAGDSTLSAMKMKVEAHDGRVTLTGSARSTEEKQTAETVARRVPGVRAVENALVVDEPGVPPAGGSMIPEVPAPERR